MTWINIILRYFLFRYDDTREKPRADASNYLQ